MNNDADQASAKASDSGSNADRLKNRVLKVGESFGNYRVVKCMSAGLMANYYHMQHVRDLRDVTIAVFHQRTMQDSNFLKRLEGLKKAIKGIKHESIRKINECAVIDERHCLFFESVEGHSLSQHFGVFGVPGQKGIELDAATRIVAQLFSILGYAHSRGLNHWDLDSDLIYVAENGDLQILGLGIKETLGVDLFESIVSASVSPLESKKVVGRLNSFDVMSPEYRGGIQEDHRVDVYGVGALAYWLLTGHKPKLSLWVPPSEVVADLTPVWDTFLKKCLERDRETRYQSCKLALVGMKASEPKADTDRSHYVQRHIERVPVPRGILDRGELATRVYRLSIIGLVGLTLTALAASFLTTAFTETSDYQRNVAQPVKAGQRPDLSITLKPAMAKVRFVGLGEQFIATDGRTDLLVQPGSYRLKVSAPHHMEQIVAVEIPRRADEPVELNISLQAAWTDFRIKSEPGAAISVLDERGLENELGVTDSEGLLSLKRGIIAGTYHIIIRKKGYQETRLIDQELALDTTTELEVPLVALPASLTVSTQPAGARITVNGAEVGVSPVTMEGVDPDLEYVVVASHANFRSSERRVAIEAGENLLLDFGSLQAYAGEVQFDFTLPDLAADQVKSILDDIDVLVDGERYRYGSSELKNISAGTHQLQVLHPLYQSDPLSIELADGEVKTLPVSLYSRPAAVELVLPNGLTPTVRVNRETVDVTASAVKVPSRATVEFELRLHNFLTMVRKFNLEPNERYVWEIEPVPIPSPIEGQSWTIPYLGHVLVWIAPATYQMGSPLAEAGRIPNEGPLTQVTFARGFWAAAYEVTQAQYREIMGQNPSEFRGLQKPVESVTWQDAKLFCEMLTGLEQASGRVPAGYVYRLPTEFEWELAARAGTMTAFSFGETADPSRGNFRGIYPKNSDESSFAAVDTYGSLPVGSFEPNANGMYDVHGNVQEWTLDIYNARLPGGSLMDPGPRTEGSRVAARGGSWEDHATLARSASREEIRMNTKSNSIGFRIVLAPE